MLNKLRGKSLRHQSRLLFKKISQQIMSNQLHHQILFIEILIPLKKKNRLIHFNLNNRVNFKFRFKSTIIIISNNINNNNGRMLVMKIQWYHLSLGRVKTLLCNNQIKPILTQTSQEKLLSIVLIWNILLQISLTTKSLI